MKDITVIIPIHKLDQNTETYFPNCIESIKTQNSRPQEVIIVHTNDDKLVTYLNDFDYGDLSVTKILNEGDTTFTGQVNFGVENVTTKWFSVLEFDDEYSNIWFENVEKYMTHYDDVDIFLPLVVDTNEEGEFLSFTNEAVWAMNFSDNMGYLDNGCLLRYPNFQSSGMVINKEKFEEIDGFKTSMKLTFVYEFLLRATYNDIKVFTIPKVGYKHVNMRNGSLFWDYRFDDNLRIESEEAKFWIETAKKEYFFTMDREIKFEPETE